MWRWWRPTGWLSSLPVRGTAPHGMVWISTPILTGIGAPARWMLRTMSTPCGETRSRGRGRWWLRSSRNGDSTDPRPLPGRTAGGPTVREMLLDMIEEYARHTGHADVLREA